MNQSDYKPSKPVDANQRSKRGPTNSHGDLEKNYADQQRLQMQDRDYYPPGE